MSITKTLIKLPERLRLQKILRLYEDNMWSDLSLHKWFPNEYDRPTGRINRGTIFTVYKDKTSDIVVLISKDKKRTINTTMKSIDKSVDIFEVLTNKEN